MLGGAFNCGKGQPGQVAPVSHGCPSVVMRGIRILNTVEEAGHERTASEQGQVSQAAPVSQELVERALAASRSDDCIVIADDGSTANLRWAGNSLTTNGVSRSRQLTVIAISRSGDEARAGVVSRAGVSADQVAELVAEAEHAAAEASPAEDAEPLVNAPAATTASSAAGGRTRPARRRSGYSLLSPRSSGMRSPPPPAVAGSCMALPSTS